MDTFVYRRIRISSTMKTAKWMMLFAAAAGVVLAGADISPNVDTEELTAAFRAMAQRLHQVFANFGSGRGNSVTAESDQRGVVWEPEDVVGGDWGNGGWGNGDESLMTDDEGQDDESSDRDNSLLSNSVETWLMDNGHSINMNRIVLITDQDEWWGV